VNESANKKENAMNGFQKKVKKWQKGFWKQKQYESGRMAAFFIY
jgi:hypothetical protein